MSVIQLSNGIIIERKKSCDFLNKDGIQIEPPEENNCYTYAFGTWILQKGEEVYINPGYTYSDGLEANVSRAMFIQKVLKDCKNLQIECECIPIEGKRNKLRAKLNEALIGENKVLIKAFWAPKDRRDFWGQYGYYHFVRKAEDGMWLEVIGKFGGVFAWDEEPQEVFAGKKLKPIAYFIITDN